MIMKYHTKTEYGSEIDCFKFNKEEEEISVGLYYLTPKHLKAINKQCQEMGWIK